MKKILLLLSAVAVMFTSCVAEGPDEPVVNDIVLTPSNLEVPSEGGSYGVVVTSDYSWTASTECDWIYVETANGNPGESTLFIYVAKNEDTISREGTVRVFSDDYNLSAELYVWQMAGEEDPYAAEWNLLTDSYGNPAKGKFRGGDFITYLFNIDPSVVVDVDIYEHKTTSGLYLVRDPWPATIVAGFGYSSVQEVENDGAVFYHNDLIIDATNPSQVVIEMQSMGVDVGYGDMYVFTGYPDYFDAAAGAGTMVDGVITFPTKGTVFYMPAYSESLFYGNTNGMILISLPGVEPFELMPECDITAITEKVSDVYPELSEQYPDDTSFVYAIFGAEIASAKYYVGDMATFERYKLDGGLTSAQVIQQYGVEMDSAMLSAIQEKGYVDIAANLLPGTPYTVAVYAENIYGKSAVAEVNHTTTGVSSTSHPCEVGVITEKFSVVYPDYASQYPDYSAFAYCLYGKELKTVKYLVASTLAFESALNQSTLEEIVLSYGDEIDASLVNSATGYVSNIIGLEPNTSYTVAVYAENIYGERSAASAVHVTDPAPDYTGELVIGDYKMSCTMGAGTENETTFENIFTVEPVLGSNTNFLLSTFAIEDNMKWKAVYDETANTLTLSGEANGLENYGPLFGNVYDIYNTDQSLYYGIFSFASEASETGKDPIVLNVDATTKQICGLPTGASVYVYIFQEADGILNLVGSYSAFDDTTTIAPYTATRAAKASVKSVAPVKGAKSFAKVPFSSVKIDKQLLERKSSFRTLQSAPVALEAANVKAFKSRTVANLSIERLINKMKTTPRSMQVKSNVVPACAKIAK